MNFRLLVTVITFLMYGMVSAQEHRFSLDDLTEGERRSLEAIALYPQDVRIAVLEVCSQPAMMVKLKRIQENSKQRFQELVEDYSRTRQEVIWDLTRFDPLMKEIILTDHSRRALEELLESYPPEIRETVLNLDEEDFALIRDVVSLQLDAEDEAFQLINTTPINIRNAYQVLLDNPEVLDILFGELDLAILVGNLYLGDKEWVMQKADSLNLALAAQNSRDLEDWKKSLAEDPEAREELLSSLDEYANEYPFDDVYYDQKVSVEDSKADEVYPHISEYYFYHYPFWFGYPHWFEYPRWVPYPIWYDWGFYPRFRTIVVFNLPRYHTIWWYLNKPHHHYRYTHLSKHIIEYRNTHREHGSSITSAVNGWRSANRDIISDDFLAGRDLDHKLKLYGQMEENREKYNRRNPSRPLSSSEYTRKYERKYEPIKAENSKTGKDPEKINREILKGLKNIPSRNPAKDKIDNKEQIRKVERAKEYHRNQTVKESRTKKQPERTVPNKKTVKPVQKTKSKRKTS